MSFRINMLPSDSYSVYIKEYLFRYPNKQRPIRTLDVTNLYNWYVENFEKKFSLIYVQNITRLFKFILEYYLTTWSHNMHMLYEDGYLLNGINDDFVHSRLIRPEDIDLTFIYNYIRTGGIQTTVTDDRLIEILNENMGTLQIFCKMVIDLLRSYNITYEQTPTDKLDQVLISHIPMQWYDTPVDIARINYSIHNYDRLYPFRVKLELVIISLNLEDYYNISPLTFTKIIEDVAMNNYVIEDINGDEL